MYEQIRRAVGRTFGFTGWKYRNEFEVKHELFHQLAQETHDGIALSDVVPGTPTCRLHAEAKALNGNAAKADLLICNPRARREFNYEVSDLIELKHVLTTDTIRQEIDKLLAYGCEFTGLYLVAPHASKSMIVPETFGGTPIHVLHPANLLPIPHTQVCEDHKLSLDEAWAILQNVLDSTLNLYGRARQQHHSFFWCNYEHETWRGHSFPSEGDFNAQLYHGLRLRLPASVDIRSEVHPENSNLRRIDFVISDRDRCWAIPVEVKMNWDQFKPAFRNGQIKTPEATVIVRRLADIGVSYPSWRAVLVVIQGQWQLPRDIRARALPLLEACPFPLELVVYDELESRIVRRTVGTS